MFNDSTYELILFVFIFGSTTVMKMKLRIEEIFFHLVKAKKSVLPDFGCIMYFFSIHQVILAHPLRSTQCLMLAITSDGSNNF